MCKKEGDATCRETGITAERWPDESLEGRRSERPAAGAGSVRPRVLVMDDQPDVRRILEGQLSALGCDVVAAPEGRTAVLMYQGALMSRAPFDLVILDLAVPCGWGGEETLRELRRLHPEVRAVICSGALQRSVAEYRELGCAAVLAKPFSRKQFRAVVDPLLVRVAEGRRRVCGA